MTTAIEWVSDEDGMRGETWNPLRAKHPHTGAIGWHCVAISEECGFCYAENINITARHGLGTKLPFRQNMVASVFLDVETLRKPLGWQKSRPVFVCSMTDLFGHFHAAPLIHAVFAVMALTPRHRFMVLTKRAQRMADIVSAPDFFDKVAEAAANFLDAPGLSFGSQPFDNVWLGFSAGKQAFLNQRWPWVRTLANRGWHTWLSAEPLLSAIHLDYQGEHALLGWTVVGGMSGRGANVPGCYLSDVERVIDAAAVTNHPLFVKQLGTRPIGAGGSMVLQHHKGGDPDEWPHKFRVRHLPPTTAGEEDAGDETEPDSVPQLF